MGGPNSEPWSWKEDVTAPLVEEEEPTLPFKERDLFWVGQQEGRKPASSFKFRRRIITNSTTEEMAFGLNLLSLLDW